MGALRHNALKNTADGLKKTWDLSNDPKKGDIKLK